MDSKRFRVLGPAGGAESTSRTLLASVARESGGAATVAGDVIAGGSWGAGTAGGTVLPKRTRQASCRGRPKEDSAPGQRGRDKLHSGHRNGNVIKNPSR